MAEPLCDAARFHGLFDALAQIGKTPEGGVHRLAASPEDQAARNWLKGVFGTLGLRTIVDPVGNMAGVLDLAGPGAPLVMSGSHLDSQPRGGRFDGALGVVAACEAAFVLREAAAAGTLAARANFAVVNWTNEEGARFQPSLLGSAALTGSIAQHTALARPDPSGTTLGAALQAIGYAGTGTLPRPAAYVELHVECGPVLQDAAQPVGVFTQYWGTVKRTIVFTGAQSHTGPTPMALRRDALLGAAHLITALRDMANVAPGTLHTSTGRIDVSPNSPNVVPSEAVLFVELRAPEPETLVWAEAALAREASEAASRAGVGLEWRSVEHRPAGRFDPALTALCRAAADIPARELATIPGHDAISLAAICPAAMLVVPSAGGLCHHPDEFTPAADLLRGAEALTRVLWQLCAHGGVP